MPASERGFTLIELMIVIVIIGILASIAIPNLIAMQNRAKEGSTKANMHTFQLTAEDYGIQHDGRYATVADDVVSLMPGAGNSYANPFDRNVGSGNSWEDRASAIAPMTPKPGLVSYSDSSSVSYYIKGYGIANELTLVLTAGQ